MDLLGKGLELMIMGMGMVFSFLIILLVVMKVLAAAVRVLNKYFPEPVAKVQTVTQISDDKIKKILAIALAKHFAK